MLVDRCARCEEDIECEQRLDDASLHVEDAGTKNFWARSAERHFVERAGGVDGVVMAQDKKLAGNVPRGGLARDADVIAANFLGEQFNVNVALAPFGSDQFGAAVGGCFFGAGRFGSSEGAQNVEHLGELGAKKGEELFGMERRAGHPAMLTIAPRFGNGARGWAVGWFKLLIYSFRGL